ncbi:MAG: TIGR03790 family protein [Labrys sp. (in: a-proteobacteria)]
MRRLFLSLFLVALAGSIASAAQTPKRLPVMTIADGSVRPLVPRTLGILVNKADPDSIALGDAYAKKRGIPLENIITVEVPIADGIQMKRYLPVKEAVDRAVRERGLRGIVVAWQKPYRVENRSITYALSLGPETSKKGGGCRPSDHNPIFAASAGIDLPFPVSMMLVGGREPADALALVQKAGDGDARDWDAAVVLAYTNDKLRSGPREGGYLEAMKRFRSRIKFDVVQPGRLVRRNDIIGYQTGNAKVRPLDALPFVVGAFVDNLTSFGGRLYGDGKQTRITEFMKAGATASYGAVEEPCNYTLKFPYTPFILEPYLRGDTLVEAYWKSVGMVTEGLFVGEPLARPFGPVTAEIVDGRLRLSANRQTPSGSFDLYRVDSGEPQRLARDLRLDGPRIGMVIADLPVEGLGDGAVLALAPAPGAPPAERFR